eukprot:1161762-Pelagomonas_calceolata.AAC.12
MPCNVKTLCAKTNLALSQGAGHGRAVTNLTKSCKNCSSHVWDRGSAWLVSSALSCMHAKPSTHMSRPKAADCEQLQLQKSRLSSLCNHRCFGYRLEHYCPNFGLATAN